MITVEAPYYDRKALEMKILYLLRSRPDSTCQTLMDEHRKSHEVTVIDLAAEKDYDKIVDALDASDKVISW